MAPTDDRSRAVIECGTHGRPVAAVVCVHMLATMDRCVGFVENSSDPEDLQAWCDECEQLFVEEGEMTEQFKKFNGMSVVCDVCYLNMRHRHTTLR